MIRRTIVIILLAVSYSIQLFAGDKIIIDVNKTKHPISKYIYGQFIEHLGKCIYGGIWAEMLEDRKFYYPITDKFKPWAASHDLFWNTGPYIHLAASPWQVIGPKGTITMDSKNPYVGEHTPVIHAPGEKEVGIHQAGLALVKDKKYKGRIILAGDKTVLPVTFRLALQDNKILELPIEKIDSEFQTISFEFTSPVSSERAALEIVSSGKGSLKIGTVSLMPADNIKGWRLDVIALLKELDSPVYRWPGGNFVSGYNWRDGIGERDKRPPRKNPAWKGVEHNDVGIHEYMELMELIDSEPFIAVNTGLGTVEEVAEEVEYCNGSSDTPMGKLRAQNGHLDPYNIKWWAVGNEMYGHWQLGNMPLKDYVKKHIKVAHAMWNVDPDIKLIGVGSVGEWSEVMLKECRDYMNLISEHIYCKEKPEVTDHVKQLAEQILRKADAHRKYQLEIEGLKDNPIQIAMDEWNYWYGNYIYGELGVRYHLKDALGVAVGLHEYFRNSDLYFMANYAQTVNVIGCIKTTPTSTGFATTGLPLKLYRHHFGTIPIEISNTQRSLDISAALTKDKKAITVAVVNPLPTSEKVLLDFAKTQIRDKVKRWLITHSDPDIYNEPDKEANVFIKEEEITFNNSELDILPYSIVMYRFEIK